MADPIIHVLQIVPDDYRTHTVCGDCGTLAATSVIAEANCRSCLLAEYKLRKQAACAIVERLDQLGMWGRMDAAQREAKGGTLDAAG